MKNKYEENKIEDKPEIHGYYDLEMGDRIILDGWFTIDELERIIEMKKKIND